MAGSFVPPDLFKDNITSPITTDNIRDRGSAHDDSPAVDLDGEKKFDNGQHFDPSIVSTRGQFVDISRNEASDDEDDLYLTLPGSHVDLVSSHFMHPRSVHQTKYQDKNGSLNASSFTGQDKPPGFRTKVTTDVRGNASSDSPVHPNPNRTVCAPILDLSKAVKGMYRILDLISEQGSGGLVDKVIIAQDSLREFINTLSPGAYTSLTKVDFRALDKLVVKPMGVYGSRQEIVRFLLSIGAIDESTSHKLLTAKDDFSGTSSPTLRSGLYIVRSFNAKNDEQLFVLYWPQETTWDDSAVSSVRRNRVTFIRYLTKICDQVTAFISSEHAEAMVWDDDNKDNVDVDEDDEESDRLFEFEVTKTNEQEENVSIGPGFLMTSSSISGEERPADGLSDIESFPPRLLFGETKQGFITAKFIPSRQQIEPLKLRSVNPLALKKIIESGTIRLSSNLDENAIKVLVDCGLKDRFPQEYNTWVKRGEEARMTRGVELKREEVAIEDKLSGESAQLEGLLCNAIINTMITAFPTLDRECLVCSLSGDERDYDVAKADEQFLEMTLLYPKIGELFQRTIHDAKLEKIKYRDFAPRKERLVKTYFLLDQQRDLTPAKRKELIQFILVEDNSRGVRSVLDGSSKEENKQSNSKTKGWFDSTIRPFKRFTNEGPSSTDKLVEEARNIAIHTSDPGFLVDLESIRVDDETVKAAVVDIKNIAQNYFNATISKLLKKLLHGALRIQQEDCMKHIQREMASRAKKDDDCFLQDFIRAIEEKSQSEFNQHVHTIDSLEQEICGYRYGPASYFLIGSHHSFQDPAVEFTVHVMKLKEEHQHTMQIDSMFVPSPNVNNRFSHSFRLPVGHNIEHGQLLENDRLLLVVAGDGKLFIFLDTLASMDGAIRRKKYIKVLHQDKIGDGFILTYEESKRILVLCTSTKLHLHVFVFDENFGSLRALGSAVNLAPWYNHAITLYQICFVCGSEEVLLVDSSAQARIFSLITLQFRPAVLQLQQLPIAVHSSPDGSCLLTSSKTESEIHFTAYHWGTLGSTTGISLGTLDLPAADKSVLTSFNRKGIQLMSLDVANHQCQSVSLYITRKVTEFMFQEKGTKNVSKGCSDPTLHNCLVDCHAEVWTRFPVLSAVRRQTISPFSKRHLRSLVFVTNRDHEHFATHFSDMIQIFEKTTKKPTGDELRGTLISALTFDLVTDELAADQEWKVSEFRVGEWLVEFLCLIPIHIAITKENRFIPLKDGVLSSELEKSLLGADVGRIVDSLSFGWYESLFQSYMASKPVKVVSSMGEQSVGKSFALNHLVDTSFAGSAMRTTEGVWMSVTPTDTTLIVALDFEGVHSIERSAQEDTLLVLFNTAISNLVLFRNNFALSRDITGLFQSFQSSSTVLDPSANPSLFQSKLVIIIKDVVESDTKEITKEFQLKFRRIVEDEQDANFISRLHGGRLCIIPWPVIESKEFYKLFPTLKRRLDQQPVTHHTAGEFLRIIKTLMAKLKANDWGALSQTMAAHRAQLLLTLLPNAMSTGFTEVEPELEQLKNFDTDIPVDKPDTSAHFFLAGVGSEDTAREQALTDLQAIWDRAHSRQLMPDNEWVMELSLHLDHLADIRIEHVHEWIVLNLSRFQAGHANIEDLRRRFENATVDLKAGVQLCKTKCASCHLLCIRGRFHEGDHDCQTSHECVHMCEFCNDESREQKQCTIPAGHPGEHICVVNAHLCGEPCNLVGTQGCLEECTRVVGHMEEDHLCAAAMHTCGKPCALTGMKLTDGAVYSCGGTCYIPSDEDHDQHLCDARLCPVTCQLCKRLCVNEDHLHGLQSGAIHLCGQEHSCAASCAAPGICEIDTTPQSIEATFTGKNETFTYTKYSQVAKRLKCIKPIAPGETEHLGLHTHGNDKNVFHFCMTRCESCGYYCTLPLGHPQQEHETSHGSMSQTRWAVDGPEGTSLELKGRKYSSNDDGAPMMCNLVCLAIGRHVHIDYCRAEDGTPCDAAEVQHIPTRMIPDPTRLKDFVTHNLHWRRMGFKDPYPRDDQTNFAKCDAMCGGPEHSASGGSGQPSYCTLPMFHPPRSTNSAPAGLGYVSSDGHLFLCKNPIVMQQAFHVIFVIDRSGSMGAGDRRPLANTPATNRIVQRSNNRLGAVYSALHSFWSARHTAVTVGLQANQTRRDAYSVILFDHTLSSGVTNDFTSTPDQLLDAVLRYCSGGGTDFTMALRSAQSVMEQNFSTERTPVIIFLSDGECSVGDQTVQDLCRSAVRLGKPLSFHAVSFGPDSKSLSLRRMAQIALDIQNTAPRDPLAPAAATVLSSYSQALDTVQLAETFLGIAESLRKPRGSLLR